jgi:hypothetical protein
MTKHWLGVISLTLLWILFRSIAPTTMPSTTTPPILKPGTPAGAYQITVTGASGSGATSLSHNTLITSTLQ